MKLGISILIFVLGIIVIGSTGLVSASSVDNPGNLPEFPKYQSYKEGTDFGLGVDNDGGLLLTLNVGNTWREPYYVFENYSTKYDMIIFSLGDGPRDASLWFQPNNLPPNIVYALFEIPTHNECKPSCHESPYGVVVTTDGTIIHAGPRIINWNAEIPFDYPSP